MQKKQPDRRYESNSYDGRDFKTDTVSAESVASVSGPEFDHFMSSCNGVLGFRTSNGKCVEYREKWPRMGRITLDVLKILQLNPGDFLTPEDIAALTGHLSLRANETLAARVCAIRKTHQDESERFIETRKGGGYGLRWPKDRTWLWIDRIAD
jgi:hypothetical protein